MQVMEGDDYRYFARAILEDIIGGLDKLKGPDAWQVAVTALKVFEEVAPGEYDKIREKSFLAEIFRRGAGRGDPKQNSWADLLKDPTEGPKVEAIMREYVKAPPDLAALMGALSQLRKLTQEATNAAAVVRIAETIIGTKRAGTAKSLRENRARGANSNRNTEGKIARRIANFVTILTHSTPTK